MAKHNWSNTAVITNLSALLTDTGTSLAVDADTGYPATNFKIWIDNEVILVGTRTGTTFSSLTRGYDGTAAGEHQNGAAVRHVTSAEDFQTRLLGFPIPEPGVGQAGFIAQYDHANLEMDWVDPTAQDFVDHGALAGLTDDDHTGYHTDSRALTWLGTRSTTDLAEGTNEYYTDAKADARASLQDHDHATPIATHAAIATAHHVKYTDSDAVNAMGILGDTNDLNHNRYTDTEADARASLQDHDHATPIATHAALASAHHTRYADSEAVTAMGVKGDSNALNHDKYVDTSAVSAVATADDYVKNDGDAMTGLLTLSAVPTADLHASTKKYVDDKNLPPIVFSSGDVALETKTGTGRLKMPHACTLVSVTATCGVAPTGADVIVDVNKGGTTMFTTQTARPKVVATNQDGTAATPAVTAIASGDVITVDVDQIGSTLPGENLTVILRIDTP